MKTRRSGFDTMSPYLYPLYILFHPSDGFFEMKVNKKGSPLLVSIILASWFIIEFMGRAVTDFDFNRYIAINYSLFDIFTVTLFAFGLAVISNWCFCVLLDGKGRMIDIVTIGAYALLPFLIVKLGMIPLSYGVGSSAMAIFDTISFVSVIWSFSVAFVGLMVMHEYTFPKTVLAVFLTLLGAVIAFFITLLLTSLIQQFINFISVVFLELRYTW